MVVLSSRFSKLIRHQNHHECVLNHAVCSTRRPPTPTLIRLGLGGAGVEPCWLWSQRSACHTVKWDVCDRGVWPRICIVQCNYILILYVHIYVCIYICTHIYIRTHIQHVFFPSIKIVMRLVENRYLPLYIYVPITNYTSWNVQMHLYLKNKGKGRYQEVMPNV